MKKFLALAKADINEVLSVSDSLVDMKIDPVYENGMTFSGQVLISGTVKSDPDEGALSSLLKDYLLEYVDFAFVQKVEFRDKEEVRSYGTYRRAS